MGKYESVGNVKIDYNRKSKGLGTYLSVIIEERNIRTFLFCL